MKEAASAFFAGIGATLTAHNLALAAAIYVGFVAALFVLRKVVPGRVHQGQVLRDGTRKSYRLNGLAILILLAGALAVGQYTRLFSLAVVNRLFWPLFVAANAFAVVHSAYLYAVGRGSEGSFAKSFAMGRDLNPDLWGIDLKMFAYVPSLMGLWVMNLSFAAAQYEALGTLTGRMMLYQSFFTIYIFNYFQFEYGMLHTWDVIAENFGLMLVWGDYVLVPFFYCICGWYLAGNLEPLPWYQAAALAFLFLVGFWLFRGSNQQKHDYKENQGVRIWGKPAETVGGRLLVSGFWGIGRKLNYTGELMVYSSWTLTTGFQSLVPYV